MSEKITEFVTEMATGSASGQNTAPAIMPIEPDISMRADGYDYDHFVQVALPTSYATTPDKRYPVLWLTDGPMNFYHAVSLLSTYTMAGYLPEMIIVAVGHDPKAGLINWGTRRTVDFFSSGGPPFATGAAGEYLANIGLDPAITNSPNNKADKFLAFLVEQLRPALSDKYRMDEDHTLFGHSAGSGFCAWSMFARPGAFQRYLLISGAGPRTLEAEEEFAKNNDDMDAKVFIATGEVEGNTLMWAAQPTFIAPLQLSRMLQLRQYPSLKLKTRVYENEGHISVGFVALINGLEFLFADEIKELTPIY